MIQEETVQRDAKSPKEMREQRERMYLNENEECSSMKGIRSTARESIETKQNQNKGKWTTQSTIDARRERMAHPNQGQDSLPPNVSFWFLARNRSDRIFLIFVLFD